MAVRSFAVLPPFGSSYRSTTDRSSSSSFYPSSKLLRISQYRFQSKSRCPKVFVSCSLKQPSDEASSDAALLLESNSIADYMRFKRRPDLGDKGTSELQTAIVRYKKRFPWILLNPFLQVDLVSTIHIADKEYFTALQKELEPYDSILYEMVTSKESLENRRNPIAAKRLKTSRSRGFSILGLIQRQMARVLALGFQLDCLNYEAKNWYHADLDFETFTLLQKEKGESFYSFARDMTIRSTKAMIQPALVTEGLDTWRSKLLWVSRVFPMPLVGLFLIVAFCADFENQTEDYPELEALSRLDIGAAMKVFLAKRLTSELTQGTSEIEEKSVIIGERNRAATEALKRAIEQGSKRVAILYGGGHMPDLGRRLREEFDLVPSEVRWVTAWSISNPGDMETTSFPFLRTMADALRWPLNRYQTLALLLFSSVLALDLCFWELFLDSTIDWGSQIAAELYKFVDNTKLV
uniref:Thermosome subunit gamma n=1 Tax=Brassica napus TaxID=3708 RepID=A3KLP3_BRANA|nr:unknown [Brassica napus]